MSNQELDPQDREQAIKQLFFDMKMLVESAADFSNGNEANGRDEGDVLGWDMWRDYMTRAKDLGVYSENNPSESVG